MHASSKVIRALAIVSLALASVGTGVAGSPLSAAASTSTPTDTTTAATPTSSGTASATPTATPSPSSTASAKDSAPASAKDSAKTPATGTTYYVDNSKGSHCSDTGVGTSESAPWCTFTPAATLTLGAGDSLLLAKGDSWSQQLSVGLQGSAKHPATLGSYGKGAAPRILDNSTGSGVLLTDPDNAVVTGLDVGAKTAAGAGALQYGVNVIYDSVGHSNLTLSDLSVHDNALVGLEVHSTAAVSVDQTVLTGLTLEDIATTHNAHGILLSQDGELAGLEAVPGRAGEKVFENVLIDGLRQSHDDNNNPAPSQVPSQIDSGCPDSLALIDATNVVVRDSILNGSAGCKTTNGTAAIFLGRLQNVLIANNMIVNTPDTQNADMVAIDHEALTSGVTITGNYLAGNYGGAIEYLAIHGPQDFSTANVTSANVLVNNGTSNAIPYPGDGAIAVIGNGITPDATISDNLSYEPSGLLNAHLSGSTADFTTSNNVLAASADDIYQSAAQYGAKATRWGYQRSAGNTWRTLGYDRSTSSYGDSGVSVDQFDVTPSASNAGAITWTAPSSGVISLRAFPLALSGSASVSVSVNGRTVASSKVGTSGALLKADDVSVRNGDVVRFAVAAGGSAVSMTPSVAYTSQSISKDRVGQWSFSVAGNAQGWTSNVPTSIRRGVADLTAKGGVTTFDSPARLNLSASKSSSLRLTYYNGTSATGGTVYFTTRNGTSFTAKDSVSFQVNPRADSGIALGFQSVIIPLSGNKDWKGTIQRLRIALNGASGDVQIDSVELAKPSVSGWEFDTAAGWTENTNADCSTPGTASANPTVDADNTTVAFSPYADINWLNSRMQQFTVSSSRLAQIDFWTYKTGDPQGCLYFRVVKITNATKHTGTTLFTGAVPPSAVSTTGGFVSIYPGLTGLDTKATYGLVIYNPYVIPGAGTYGVGYTDDSSAQASTWGEFYAVDNNGTWNGPETNRSLEFKTYTAAKITPRDTTVGYQPVTVSGGLAGTPGGYEPALLSPQKLGIAARSIRYLHIRMNNPDGRPAAYVLFTTKTDPTFDQPGDGWPVPEESGGKGVVIALDSDPGYHDYTIDLSKVKGWKGTIEQLMVEPSYRGSYRTNGDLSSTWSGKIDYIRLDDGTTDASTR